MALKITGVVSTKLIGGGTKVWHGEVRIGWKFIRVIPDDVGRELTFPLKDVDSVVIIETKEVAKLQHYPHGVIDSNTGKAYSEREWFSGWRRK
jgi:hypothetical protein